MKKEIDKKKVLRVAAFNVGGVCLAISAGMIINRSKLGFKIKDYMITKLGRSIVKYHEPAVISGTVSLDYYTKKGFSEEYIKKTLNEAVEYFYINTSIPFPEAAK